ncbi:MAG: hypothetical protein DRJ55_04095 [Thermoprotei archaeon]|nr:MAG: hypothetical protein DRJ55_04095 [Thermoprotei archaeon]
MPKRREKAALVHVSVRIPEGTLKIADMLVDLGIFKDRSELINYAIKQTLKEYLLNIRIQVTPQLVESYFKLLEQASPRLTEEEAARIAEEIRSEQKRNKSRT